MTRYIVLREDFQGQRWETVGLVNAMSPEDAVKTVQPNVVTQMGTFAAIPTDDYEDFIGGRTLYRITARIEVVEFVQV